VTEIVVVTIETVAESSHEGECGPLGKKVLVVHICARLNMNVAGQHTYWERHI
jgi:hypothetical protein